MNGNIQRKTIAIILMDESGQDAARWEVVEAWPSKYAVTDLKAEGEEAALEILEICHEGLSRVS